MKDNLINRTLMPPESSKWEIERNESEEKALNWVRYCFKPEEVFDLYEHDKAVSFPFAEYLSYHYVTVRTEEGYRHKQNGNFYTTEQVWAKFSQK